MAVSEEFLQYVTEQFRELGEVSTRRMFGGIGVYFESKFFALLDNDELYMKVDDTNRPQFAAAGSRAFEPWAGHVMNGYWSVPAEVLESPTLLAEWSRHPLAIANKAKKKPAKKHL
jgi:DNA transformation protein and related proteins